MKLTAKQTELWIIAEAEIRRIGGLGRITHNRDATIRAAAKTEGTREWALCESTRLASPLMDDIMTDEFCQRLIDCI